MRNFMCECVESRAPAIVALHVTCINPFLKEPIMEEKLPFGRSISPSQMNCVRAHQHYHNHNDSLNYGSGSNRRYFSVCVCVFCWCGAGLCKCIWITAENRTNGPPFVKQFKCVKYLSRVNLIKNLHSRSRCPIKELKKTENMCRIFQFSLLPVEKPFFSRWVLCQR